MRHSPSPALFVASLLAFAAGSAHALPDVKTLAKFDLGFAKCEARYAHMKGHRDEAYLALWTLKPNAQQTAALAQQRKSASYRQARAQAQKTQAPDEPGQNTPAFEEKIRQQCQGTWSETLRNRPPGSAASRPKATP